jgi:hypothetical protein
MDSANLKAAAIKAGADPDSLVRRPLTWESYSKMGEAEQCWHCVENSKAVDAVHEVHSKEAREAVSHAKREVQKIVTFDVKDRAALGNLMIENGSKFSEMFPQFVGSRKNTDRVLQYMRENELLPDVENFIIAFQALAHLGKMTVDPSKTGLSDETELSGAALQNSPQLNRLLAPVTPALVLERQVQRMSPEAFAKWDREQHGSKELPWVIKEQVNKAFVTLAANHPEFRATDSDKTKLLDYLSKYARTIDAKLVETAFQALKSAGELELNENVVVQTESGSTWTGFEQMDGRTYTEKQESLRRKINRMTDPEFREFVNHSPANRRAVDNL